MKWKHRITYIFYCLHCPSPLNKILCVRKPLQNRKVLLLLYLIIRNQLIIKYQRRYKWMWCSRQEQLKEQHVHRISFILVQSIIYNILYIEEHLISNIFRASYTDWWPRYNDCDKTRRMFLVKYPLNWISKCFNLELV